MSKIIERLMPFFMIGIMVVLFVVGVVIFSYLLILGAIVGVILFAVSWFRERFFTSKRHTIKVVQTQESGRTIDHDEIK